MYRRLDRLSSIFSLQLTITNVTLSDVFSAALLLTLSTHPSAHGRRLAMPPEEGLMTTPKALLLWGSPDSSTASAVRSSSTKETASAWSSSSSRWDGDSHARQARGNGCAWTCPCLNPFQARHTTYGIRKCFLFLLQCQLSLVLIQVKANDQNRCYTWMVDVNAELGGKK